MKDGKSFLLFLVIFYLFTHATIIAQTNLILNYSFEEHDTCPNSLDQLSYALHWYSPTTRGSPDYFDSCASIASQVNVPDNLGGYQYARTGVAYAGFITYLAGDTNSREYIQTKLDTVLIANHKYCVEFYVSLGNVSNLAINNMGMYISNTAPIPPYESVFSNYVPQINDTTPITDTVLWTRISGSFIAHGGEQYITIGNFYSDSLTETIRINNISGNDGSYYYIDDVSLVDCTSGAGVATYTNIDEVNISPNPFTNSTTISFSEIQKNTTIKIMDIVGKEIKTTILNGASNFIIDRGTMQPGIYFVQITDENKNTVNRKIVVQ